MLTVVSPSLGAQPRALGGPGLLLPEPEPACSRELSATVHPLCNEHHLQVFWFFDSVE